MLVIFAFETYGTMLIKNRHNNPAATIERLFPKFGSKAQDVPAWDAGKGMFLVDQYQSKSGNRSLTYVGISDRLLLEMTVGHFHSWEFVNKVRAMVFDGDSFKVVATCDWPQSSHLDMSAVREEVRGKLEEYAIGASAETGLAPEQIRDEVERILSSLFVGGSACLDSPLRREILAAYCTARCVCRDFTGQEECITI